MKKYIIEWFMFFLILIILGLNVNNTYRTINEYFLGVKEEKTIKEGLDIGKEIKKAFNKAINKIKGELNKIKDQILGIFNKIEETFNEISRVLSSIPTRMANIEKGFKMSMEAIGDEIENLGKGLGLGFKSTFELIEETGTLSINAMECGIDKINYLPQCFPIYIFDMIIYFNKLIFKSILNAAELYIGFKKNFGIDMQFYLDYLNSILVYMDKMAYNVSGFHFMKYPDFILNRCYRCRQKVDAASLVAKSKEVSRAFNNELPRLLNEPVYKFKNAQRSFEDAFKP